MPHGGHPRDDLLPGLRTFAFRRRVVIAYLAIGEAVHVTNVFYGGRDFDAFYGTGPGDPSPLDPEADDAF